MNIVRLFKKRRHTIMVWLLVLIMIAFLGGTALQQVLSSRGPSRKVVAVFADGTEIRAKDRVAAANELEVLRAVGGGRLLQQTGLNGLIAANLLFPDGGTSSMLETQLKYAAMQGNLTVSEKVVDKFFNAEQIDPVSAWMMLNKEVYKYGASVSSKNAQKLLVQYMGDRAGTIIKRASRKMQTPQEDIVEVFAKMLSVVNYVDMAVRNSNITAKDLEAAAGFKNEKFSAQYVNFPASKYTDQAGEPSQEQMEELFEKYKSFTDQSFSSDNPYGFGYKIEDCVKLDYLIVQSQDVKDSVEKPTESEKEEYYSDNKSKYTQQKPKNPEDENSEKIEVTQPYSKVIRQVENDIINMRKDALMKKIFNDLADLIEAGYENRNPSNLSGEKLQELSGSYKQAAEEVSEKYGIKIYSGRTGWLSRERLTSDRNLGRLSLSKERRLPVNIVKLTFSVKGLEAENLSEFDRKTPKIYENIGPLENMWPQNKALIRVVDFKESYVPEDIEVAFEITGSLINETDAQKEFYTVRDEVREDFKDLAGMETAEQKANAFIQSADDKPWSEFLKDYNEENSTNLTVKKLSDKSRISQLQLYETKVKSGMRASGKRAYVSLLKDHNLYEAMHGIAGGNLPNSVKVPSKKTVYAVENVDITPAQPLEDKKAEADRIKSVYSGEAALVFLNPENLVSRTGFEFAEDEEQQTPEAQNEG
ncbi:hypothetical protein L21SP3_02251 [Sedimentisphaera cyanobacteriorum]|uniref:Uncharacterized protein n=1 Tax=Sedimentisphaera cyanobacteriorum TaxID=1940790 RepID=A0A1Q2HSI7_9BACT|nr:hypothetical protein [Sedimentisphaera cyanobacteriorum]AQQ10419.1 hypothetical protein L21SP3_02251 [Sedimentisphaera cyanobacteriorum]